MRYSQAAARFRSASCTCLLMAFAATGLLWLVGTPVLAHGADIKALITFAPVESTPRLDSITLTMLDFFNSPVSRATVRAEIKNQSNLMASTTILQEGEPGRYTGHINIPRKGRVELHIKALLPDGPWRGAIRFTIGDGWRADKPIGVVLRHVDTPLITPLGLVLGALTSVIAIGSIAGLSLEICRYFRLRGPRA